MRRLRFLPALVLFAVPSVASAMTYDVHAGDDLFGILSNLAAGDEVVIHDGTYTTPGFFEVTWAGTSASPIVVRGADGEHPIIQGDMSQNVINLSGSYFTLENVEITGGSHGIRLANADHGTLKDLKLHLLGDVGISCNRDGDTCDSMTIAHNEIFDTGHAGTGEGMYLGCNDGLCTFSNSIVEQNFVHDTGGDQGDGIEIKTGSFGNDVRDNVIVRTMYPAITMYGFAGGGAPNVVERNLVWTTGDNGIQIVGQIVVRNNIVIGAAANGIQSKSSQNFMPNGAIVEHNTIWGAGGACFKSNDWATSTGQIVANNAFYCNGGTAIDLNGGAPAAMVAGNIGLGSVNAPGGVMMGAGDAQDLGDPMNALVYPPAGSALIDKGDGTYAVPDDFNGTMRADGSPDVGAYEVTSATNPGWTPGEGFKDGTSGAGGSGATTSSSATGATSTGSASGASGATSTSGAGGRGGAGSSGGDDSGCGCRVAGVGGEASPAMIAAALAIAGGIGLRRRGARRRSRS